VAAGNFQLLNLQRHLTDSATTILKPDSLFGQVTVQIILLGIGFKQLGLRQKVIMSLHLIFEIHIVLILHKLTLTMPAGIRLIH
jgi:hypothetical protein